LDLILLPICAKHACNTHAALLGSWQRIGAFWYVAALAMSSVKEEALPGPDAEIKLADWKEVIWSWFVNDTESKDQHIGDVLLATWGNHKERFAEASAS